MKLWKAPIFYIGIALVLAIGAALAAPYLIDWGSYRQTIEGYGEKLTGRQVRVAGDISGRLFPWPRLTINDVHIANPDGAKSADFVKAARIDVRMTLAGVFDGEIKVETIDVFRPEIAFERMGNGKGTWMLEPRIDLAANPALERIRLDEISINGGTVHLIDSRRKGKATFTNVNGMLTALDAAGPWRMRATAAYRDLPIEVGIDTGSWRGDQPLKFGFRISPLEGAGLVYQFDGQNDGKAVSGRLRIEPASDAKGKDDTEGSFRPLALTAKLTAGFDTVSFDKIEIAPRDSVDGGTNLLSGSAKVSLGPTIGFSADLAATRFDLDAVAGNKAREMLRDGALLELLDGLIASLPPNIDIEATLKVTALVAGGQTVDNAKLRVGISDEAIRIRELSASLPGQARALFDGIFLPTDAGPQLSGNLSYEAGSLRDFVGWVWPEGTADVERIWTGGRGRLKLMTKVDAASGQLRLHDIAYQLDDAAGTGSLAMSFGARPSADIRINASVIDIDRYLPRGVEGGGWIEVAGLLPLWAKDHDLRFTLQAAEALVNGVSAHDVAIDVAAEKGSIDLKMVEIGNVGNARLETIGLISPATTGIEGSLSTTVIAEDPRGLLRLFGVIPQGGDPLWTKALGKTDLKIVADFASDAGGQTANYKIAGKSGFLAIDATFDAAGGLHPADSELSGAASITSETSAGLLALAGLAPAIADAQPASLHFSATGSFNAGLVAEADVEVLGAKGQFRGKLSRSGGEIAGSGRVGFLSERPGALLGALGIAGSETNAISFESDVELTPLHLSFKSLKGFAEAAPIGGEISIGKDGRVKGELATGPLSLGRLLALTFLPWDGKEASSEDAFAAALPGGITGEFWLRPQLLTVYDGFTIAESQIGIIASAGERRLVAFGKAGASGDVNVEVGGRNAAAGLDIDAHVVLPVDLGTLLKFENGGRAATGLATVKLDAKASGRSPAAIVAALAGTSSYDITNLTIAGIDAESFVNQAREAKTAEELKAALVALTGQGEVALGSAKGDAAIDHGATALPQFVADDGAAKITFTPRIDFGEGKLDVSARIEWKGLGDVPDSDIAYGGPPSALARFADTSALESALGFRIFERGLKELERVQAEQKRLLEEEERQRKEDEAKLAAYLAQRRENQLRLRELRIHGIVREQQAAQAKAALEQAIKDGAKQNRAELKNRLRERMVHRALRRLEREKAEAQAKAAQAEIERIKADLEKREALRLDMERERAAKLQAERELAEKLKAEQALAAKFKAERALAEKLMAEQELAEKFKAEQALAEKLKAEQALAAKFKAEQELAEKLRAEQEQAEAEAEAMKAEQARLQDKAEQAAIEAPLKAETNAAATQSGSKADAATQSIEPFPAPKPKRKPKAKRKPAAEDEDKTPGAPLVLVPPQKHPERKRNVIDFFFPK